MFYSSFALLSLLLLFVMVCSTHGRRVNLTDPRTNATVTEQLYPISMIVSHSKVIFPSEDISPVVYPVFPDKLTGTECVHNICDSVDDYPAEYILKYLRGIRTYDEYFKDVVLPIDIADRNNFDDEDTLCQARKQTKFPRMAVNVNNTKRLLANVDEYRQGLVLETCMENAKCKFSEMFPNDYEVTCKQRYTIRRLVAIDDEQKPAFDSFEIPSCCVCTYKKKG